MSGPVFLVSSALVASVLVALPAQGSPAVAAGQTAIRDEPVVPSAKKPKPMPSDPAAVTATRQVPTLPVPGVSQVQRGAGAAPGGVVSLVDPSADAMKLARPGLSTVASARVEVLDAASAATVSAQGLAFRIARGDGVGEAGPAGVSIDYSGFRELYGGGWASRLRVYRYPACVLTSPKDPACAQGTPLPVVSNDLIAGKLVVDVSADPDPAAVPLAPADQTGTTAPGPVIPSALPTDSGAPAAAPAAVAVPDPSASPTATDASGAAAAPDAAPVQDSGSVLALAASASGSSGGYTATSLQPSGNWQVGVATGEFSWSHHIPAPAPAGGPTPDLNLTYSSGAVDGLTMVANQQGSTVGTGWELSAPYIERSFAPCHSYLASHPAWGDLCYPGLEFAQLVVNGSSSPLVYIPGGTGQEWRVQSKPGWRVQRIESTATNNGDYEGTYWVITDPQGTQYWYGTGNQSGPGLGASTKSALRVPVYGGSGQCGAGGWCWLAYRWYLDRVIDTNGNQSTYFYDKEINHYNSIGDTTTFLDYDRALTLNHIDYGARASSPAGTQTNSLVFDYELRCSNQAGTTSTNWNVCSTVAQPTDEPEVPTDQLCATSPCSSSQTAPTFFTQKLLRQIGSFVAHGGTKAQWLERFFYSFPTSSYDTPPSMWLLGVQHIGVPSGYTWPATFTAASYSTSGQTLTPMVSFGSNGQDGSTGLLTNRRDWDSTTRSPLKHFRVRFIQNELGGRLWVNYSTDDLCDNTPPSWDTQTSRCFPQWWSPPDAPAGFGVFYKYTVDSVVQSDRWSAAPDVTTSYAYGGTPAWHYQDIPLALAPQDASFGDKRSWTDWRGYASVIVTKGSQRTSYLVYRGLKGDKRVSGGCNAYAAPLVDGTNDWPYNQGLTRQVKQLTASGSSHQTVTYTYMGEVMNGDPIDPVYCTYYSHVAYLMANTVQETVTAEHVVLTSTITRDYDTDGRLITEQTANITSGSWTPTYPTGSYYACQTTEYATNPAATPPALLDVPARVRTYQQTAGQTCTVAAPQGTQSGQADTYYDGNTTLTGLTLSKGNPTKVDTYTGAGVTVSASTGYDTLGRVTSSTDANGHQTTYTYAPTTGYPNTLTVTNAIPQSTVTTYDYRLNVPATVTDVAGHATQLKYDDLGRLVCVWAPQNPDAVTGYPGCTTSTTDPANQIFLYNNTGSAIPNVVTKTRLDDATPNPALQVRYDYLTGFGQPRETQTANPSITAAGQTLVSDTYYDNEGQVSSQSLPAYSTVAPGAGFIDPDPALSPLDETRTSYDEFLRPTTVALYRSNAAVTGSDGYAKSATTSYSPVGTITAPAAGGGTVSYVDAAGRPVRDYTLGTSGGSLDTQYTYAYDANGKLTATRSTQPTQGTGTTRVTSSAQADWLGRTLTATGADSGTSTFTYKDGGQLLTSTTPTTPVTNLYYTYDNIDRPTAVYQGTNTSGTLLKSWTYDTGTGNAGQLVADTSRDTLSQTWARSYTYDPAGRRASITVTPPTALGFAASYRTNYTSGAANQILTVGYPSASGAQNSETLAYSYDALGNLDTTTGSGIAATAYITDTVYNTNGTLKNRLYKPAATTWSRAFSYTPGDRRVSAVVMASTGITPTITAQSDSLAWDSTGNLTSVIDTTTNQQTACYQYDQYQRLTRAVTITGVSASGCATPPSGAGTGTVPWSYTYALDGAGGLTTATDNQTSTTTTYTYPASGTTPHLPSSITVGGGAAQTLTTDGAGRVKTIGSTTLTWDQFGMAATATSGGVTTTSAYTADGSRIARTDSTGSATLFLPDQEITKTGSTLSYVRYIKHGVATVAVRTNDTTVAILTNDIQNTPSISISSTNAITRRYTTPYGAQISSSGGTLAGQRRFLDHVQDPTGFLDDAARTYSPTLGIFLSPDPLSYACTAAATNTYAYAGANPTSYTDPSGLFKLAVDRLGDGDKTEVAPQLSNSTKATSTGANGSQTTTDEGSWWDSAKSGIRDVVCGVGNGLWYIGPGTVQVVVTGVVGGSLSPLGQLVDKQFDNAHDWLEAKAGANTDSWTYRSSTGAGFVAGSVLSGGAGVVKGVATGAVRAGSRVTAYAFGSRAVLGYWGKVAAGAAKEGLSSTEFIGDAADIGSRVATGSLRAGLETLSDVASAAQQAGLQSAGQLAQPYWTGLKLAGQSLKDLVQQTKASL